MLLRSANRPARDVRADEEGVGLLVELVGSHEPSCELDRLPGRTSRQTSGGGLPKDGCRQPGRVASLGEQPCLEGGACLGVDTLKQLLSEAGNASGLNPGGRTEREDVDECVCRQLEDDRIAPDNDAWAECPSQLRQVPAKRSQWIAGVPEQESREPGSGRGCAVDEQVGE
jgi:hypothetical protein